MTGNGATHADLYQSMGRLEGAMDGLKTSIENLHDDIRDLPCRDKSGIVPAECPAPRRRPTSEEERVEKKSARTRARVRGWLEIVKLAVAIGAGAGLTGAVRCGMAPAQPQHHRPAIAAPVDAGQGR